MARGELMRKLLLSHVRGDEATFRSIAMQIIAEEEQKNNHKLARNLLNIIDTPTHIETAPRALTANGRPKDKERESFLVDVRYPSRSLDDIILSSGNADIVHKVLNENQQVEILRSHGLAPSTKLLFCGPPGCGKTMCAEIIASELGLPLLYARFDAIVSSYLGETAANIRRVFEYASGGRWILFFDEFDAIGKERGDPHEHGELKRVVNSFLQLLDSFNTTNVVIAATNHERLLDSALWRRFDEVVYFPKPATPEIRGLLISKLKNFPTHDLDLDAFALKLKGMSHSDVEQVCMDAIKCAVLSYSRFVDQDTLDQAFRRQKTRLIVSSPSRLSKRTKQS